MNRNGAKCADVWCASAADGADVNSGTCDSATNQQWVLTPAGSSSAVRPAGGSAGG
ncbi:RICIN domain-containing protein [Streptomyces sp. NPDC087903]|uniref:RICIN domain-containing protein n=1 Tax=Streptomyces sp. NPDC087903 TaxID=3365819 RepID=UPI00382AAEF6